MAEETAPGWFPDPDDEAYERYWDGRRWLARREALLVVPGWPHAPMIPLTTLAEVPGCRIVGFLGLVVGVGHPSMPVMTDTGQRSTRALQAAEVDLRANAMRVKAHAVVGIVMSSYSGGDRSAMQAVGVQLLGSAVLLAPRRSADQLPQTQES